MTASEPASASRTAAAPATGHSVAISRIYRANREQLWRAWTDPAQLTRWFGMSEDARTEAAIDLAVGGAVRITMISAATGERNGMTGTVLACELTRKLVYTWACSGGAAGAPPSRVTVEFRDHPQGSELALLHEQFHSAQERDGHLAGWSTLTDRLRQHLTVTAGDAQPAIRSMAAWFDIPVLDLERACAFYRAVLGVEIAVSSFPGGAVGVLPHGGGAIGGCLVKGGRIPPSDHGGVLLYLDCEGRLDEAVAAVGAHGGAVVTPRHAIGPHGFRAVVRDSEGNMVALHSH
jgi:uncharacterized protein YndB with AHSA1/START domain/predicted enzyme related to lactoylglutathione lyase